MIFDALNRALHDLRLSVTPVCNFNCRYCKPTSDFAYSKNRADYLTHAEMVRLVQIFVQLGVRKLRLTGGEPLVKKDLPELISDLARIENLDDIALTTNGYFLAQKAQTLIDAGLNRVTVSLSSLDDQIFGRMNGTEISTRPILEGIEQAAKVGLTPVKINVVVERGVNDHSVTDLVRYFRGSGNIIRFIEFMDVGSKNNWQKEKVVATREIIDLLMREFELVPLDKNYCSEVAERFRIAGTDDEIGFISSVTQPFCHNCQRARITADGLLFNCLFGSAAIDLRTPLRNKATDAEMMKIIQMNWSCRDDRYSEMRNQLRAKNTTLPKVEMYQIGG